MSSQTSSDESSSSSYLLARSSCALGIFAALLGSTAPSPLYPLYVRQMQLSHAMGTAVFATYAFGTLFALALTARIGTRVRDLRQLIVPGLLVTAAGAALFAVAHDVVLLIIGRFFNGLGTGIVTGMASVALYDLAPPKGKALAAAVATLVFTGGAAGGPLLSSAALALDVAPTLIPFLIIVAIALIACAGLFKCQWPSRPARTPATKAAKESKESMDAGDAGEGVGASRGTSWAFYGLACFAVAVAWMVGSTLMAIGADLGQTIFVLGDASLAGLIPALFQLFGGIGQAVCSKVHPVKAIGIGLAGMLLIQIAQVGAAWGVHGSIVLGLMSMDGFMYGVAFVGALGLASSAVAPDQRERLISGFYIVGYLANAIPSLLMGVLIDQTSLGTAYYVFSGVMVVLAACAVGLAGRLVKRKLPSRQTT